MNRITYNVGDFVKINADRRPAVTTVMRVTAKNTWGDLILVDDHGRQHVWGAWCVHMDADCIRARQAYMVKRAASIGHRKQTRR